MRSARFCAIRLSLSKHTEGTHARYDVIAIELGFMHAPSSLLPIQHLVIITSSGFGELHPKHSNPAMDALLVTPRVAQSWPVAAQYQ